MGFLSRLSHFIVTSPLLFITIPVYLINWIVLFQTTRAKKGRVRITSLEKEYQTFVAVTLDALALIEKYDPRHYARLQKELLFITDTPLTSFGEYDHAFWQCSVDFAQLGFDWDNHDAPDYADHY